MDRESTLTDLDQTVAYDGDFDADCGVVQNLPELCQPGTSQYTKGRKGNIHCCWGQCKTDNRYLYKAPKGTFFIPFPKVPKIKEGMTKLEIKACNERIEKAKRWVHLCYRKNFTIKNINKNTYICSLHFIGSNGPTPENPDPIKASSDLNVSLIPKKRY